MLMLKRLLEIRFESETFLKMNWKSVTAKNACETVMGTWNRILKTIKKNDSLLER